MPTLLIRTATRRFSHLNFHADRQLRVNAPRAVGLPRRDKDFVDQTGKPEAPHLRRRKWPVFVSVIAGAADPEESAALLGPVAGLDEVVDYQVNPFGPGRSSPRSFAAIFNISTSVSSYRIRFFALASSAVSGGLTPGRSPRSIWSWRTQPGSAAALTPSWPAAVVMALPARTSATARRRNSAGNGRGMDEASQRRPDLHPKSGNQTVGHVNQAEASFCYTIAEAQHFTNRRN
jgi:hypothetical protein